MVDYLLLSTSKMVGTGKYTELSVCDLEGWSCKTVDLGVDYHLLQLAFFFFFASQR